MSFVAAANLLESPLVLMAVVLISALASWLMKRRSQEAADAAPNESQSSPMHGEQHHSTQRSDWRDVIHQLLRDPPQVLTLPQIARASSDEQTSDRENDLGQVVPLDARRSGRPIRARTRRRSRVGGGVVRRWRDPRVVRRAFMASLVFGRPKALER